MKESESIQMSNGQSIPCVGFGTYLISNEKASEAVSKALELGYRHIDTAEAYRNEDGVGLAIHRKISEGTLTRDEIFVTTKLWPGNSEWGEIPRNFESTLTALEESLKRLRLDYVDLYLIHAPLDPEYRVEQWRGLVELQRLGKAKTVGVSNFNEKHISELTSAGLPLPSVDQIELHPWSQKSKLVNFLRSNDILPIAYSSLVPLSTWRSEPGQESAKTAEMIKEGENSMFKSMAEKYKVSEAQILLRWAVQKGYPVLPKSLNADRMAMNLDVFSFSLLDEDMHLIEKMDRGGGVAWAIGDPTNRA